MSYWWELPKNNAHEEIFNLINELNKNQGWLKEGHLRNMRLYGNLNTLGLSQHTFSQSMITNPPYDRLGLNIVQSMCDTVTQKVAKNAVRPMFLTEGGNWMMQEKAKLLNKFVEGKFYELRVAEKGPLMFRDGTVYGSGFLKIYKSGKKIRLDRCFAGEIIVDESEAIYGEPRCMYQIKVMPKEYLLKLFPKYASQIKSVRSAENNTPNFRHLSDQVWVTEAWHLPASEDSGDGRHIMCIQNATFLDEEYKSPRFPFIKFDWSKRLLGYMGQGLAEQLTGLQVEINKILKNMQITGHLFVPKLMLEMGSKIVKSQLNNEIGGLVWYSGTKPEVWAPNAFPQTEFERLIWLYQRSYEIAGISQLAANSTKPAGLNSGRALREFNDIESERFILVGKSWEQVHLDLATHIIELSKEIADEYEDAETMAMGDDGLEVIKWSDINLNEDQYVMKVYPSSFISKTPAAALQDTTDLLQAGLIDQKTGMRLLDFPDLKQQMKYDTASDELIYKIGETMIKKGKYISPEPQLDLVRSGQIMLNIYLKAKLDGVPDSKLELLRTFMVSAEKMVKDAQAKQMMQQQAMQPQAPMAQPEAAPVSDMLPITG